MLTSTVTSLPDNGDGAATECRLIEGRPVAHTDHIGLKTPGGWRRDLTQDFTTPQFYHFGVDREGGRLISDYWHANGRQQVYLARLPDDAADGPAAFTYLLDSGAYHDQDYLRACSNDTPVHIHPFLSPDGSMGFFNSDESGLLQAYMVRGLPGPA